MNDLIKKILLSLPMGTFVYIGTVIAYGVPFIWWLFLIIIILDQIDEAIQK